MKKSANSPGQRTGSAQAPALDLAPRFVLRAAGLPLEAIHALRSTDLRRWADELLDEQERLADLGALLSEPLAALVKSAAPASARHRALALRRDVFNNRLPHDPQPVLKLAATLDNATATLLTQWLHAHSRLAHLHQAGTATFDSELRRTRSALRHLAERPELRHGLLLASATLDSRLDAACAPGAPDKRTRKLERALLSYVYRTASKTSPFSTLTTVAAGTFGATPHDGQPVEAHPKVTHSRGASADLVLGQGQRSHPRLNVVVLARLAELITTDPQRRQDLPVTLAGGWVLEENRVRYVRRSVSAGDDSAAVSFDAVQDRIFFLRLSNALEHLLELVDTTAPIRYRELTALLCRATNATPAEAEHYLSVLLGLDILQLDHLATDVHSPDPLRSFQDALRRLGAAWAEQIADRLQAPAACLAAYPGADVPTRRALLAHLRQELLSLQSELGAQAPSLPQTLLYEDVTTKPVQADPRVWLECAVEPLRQLAAVLPIFDVALAQRLTLKGFFLIRYGRGGRCQDLLRLVHDFHEDIFRQYVEFTAKAPTHGEDRSWLPEENWLGLAEVTALDRARARFTRRMHRLWQALPHGAEELELDAAALRSVASELAPLGGRFEPSSHFLQLADGASGPLAVLNNSYGGLCFPFTRFTHCFEAADGPGLGEDLRDSLRDAQPPGAVFAEVTAGAATTNLNLHSRLTDYEIVCPGESSTAAHSARIPLEDLCVEHDIKTDRLTLRSRRLGREVIPLYLGYLVPMLLPEVPRTLLLFSPTSRITPDPWRGIPAAPALQGVTRRPRVRHGALVLSRRSWCADATSLPVPRPGDSQGEHYLRWQRWRRRHALPDQVFARIHPHSPSDEANTWTGPAKPHYVDFDSPLSLLALDHMLTHPTGQVVFEEMLPGEQALHVRSVRGHHVAELAIELIPRASEHARTPAQARSTRP
ncbi:lantibiotic dehydratase [Kitasatospora sp. GAS204B]|uniref:lantibiotic dehydratase n=1 Tax=unclassified Kitasatospora TaxID=2633591 RepID=UPI002474118A|nr:lantibiotic dehydratase [Kitasatospora sp. GAS204B]MDH6119753.1 hypothetical protein [Kitasatospora sp. GAS204B]